MAHSAALSSELIIPEKAVQVNQKHDDGIRQLQIRMEQLSVHNKIEVWDKLNVCISELGLHADKYNCSE